MELAREEIQSRARKLVLREQGREIARIWIYFIRNDLHTEPYAVLEDLFVQEACRGKGYGKQLIREALDEARKEGCYKVIMTSRHERKNVHELYLKLGFTDYGKEFRLSLGA